MSIITFERYLWGYLMVDFLKLKDIQQVILPLPMLDIEPSRFIRKLDYFFDHKNNTLCVRAATPFEKGEKVV